MNLKQLDAFRAVMLTGSVTNASEWLHISQPAVSRLIGDFERSLGFALFIRTKGSALVPTPEAVSFYQEVERSFAGLEALKKSADDIKHFRAGQLRIACLPALAMGFLPRTIQRFLQIHPAISVQLQTRSSATVRQWVAAQQFDLGIARPGEYPGVEVRPFSTVSGVCALPPGHRLTKKRLIRPADLQDEPFVSLGLEDLTRSRIDKLFQDAGVNRNVVVETQYAATICGLVLEGVGCSIINPVTALDFADRGLVVRRFSPRVEFEYMLFLPMHRPVSIATASFLEVLQETNIELLQRAREITGVANRR